MKSSLWEVWGQILFIGQFVEGYIRTIRRVITLEIGKVEVISMRPAL